MIKRTLKGLKPFALALIVLVLTPCVAEFVLRVSLCQKQLASGPGALGLDVAPSWYTHHELVPLQLVSHSRDSSLPPVNFRTNSLGLRGPEIEISPAPEAIRIVCLGDEVVLGASVDEPQLFSEQLRIRLQALTSRRVEVINAGVPDFCPLLSLLQFRHRLMSLQPDIVIAHFDMSDVWDDRRFRRLTELGPQEQPLICASQELSSSPMTMPFSQNFASWQWAQSRLAAWLGPSQGLQTASVDEPRAKYDWLAETSNLWRLQADLAVSPFSHLATMCRKQGIRLMLAMHPAPWQLSATASRGARNPELNGVFPGTLLESRYPQQLLTAFATDGGLPLSDAIDFFRNHASVDDLFCKDSHELSEAGHRLYAAVLSNSLQTSFPEFFGARRETPSLNEPREFAGENGNLQPLRPAAYSGVPPRVTNSPAGVPRRTAERLPNDLVPISGER